MANPMYEEGAHNAPMSREAAQYPPPPQAYGQDPYAYGRPPVRAYGGQWRQRHGSGGGHGSIETKPFYLTSEFLVSLLAAIGIAISAATMTAFGGWRAWILITAIVASYNLSRGIAKCATRSRAYDPREDLQLGRGMMHNGGASEQDTRVTAQQ